ncbi:MAG: cation diffusion facilitator family transporter [Candidatus Aminicenantales bacterium]
MAVKSGKERQRTIRSITWLGVAVNFFLVVLKLISGIIIRSSALIADSIHSLSDLSTDFVVLVGTHLSSRPPDKTHPYGHKRFETIASQLISFILLVVSFGLLWSAGTSIFYHRQYYPGYMMLAVAVVSVVAKEILFYRTRKISRITGSAALYANAWHHRSDSLSSMAVLIGGAASLLGWGYADQAATIVVAFMIMGVAGKIFLEGFVELTEHAADRESIQKLEKVLSQEKKISSWHALRTRKLGGELFADVHILVNPNLSVLESHQISVRLEKKIRKELSKPVNVLIHIEPEKNYRKK